MFAAITAGTLLTVIIWLVVAGLIYAVIDWGLNKIALPPPFSTIARVLLVLITVILIVSALLGLTGDGPLIRFGR